MMQRFIHSIPIGRKIFGLAISMLVLLIALSAFTYVRVKDVANELLEISEFLVPLTALLANIDVHALEQEIHLERMLRLYEIAPLNVEHMSREGFMADWSNESGEIRIAEHNCAMHAVAERYPEICDSELQFLQELFGPDVVRQQHIVNGCNSCEYALNLVQSSGPDGSRNAE